MAYPLLLMIKNQSETSHRHARIRSLSFLVLKRDLLYLIVVIVVDKIKGATIQA